MIACLGVFIIVPGVKLACERSRAPDSEFRVVLPRVRSGKCLTESMVSNLTYESFTGYSSFAESEL